MNAAANGTTRGTRGLHILLSAANFAQGLGAFGVLGIVADVARDLHVPVHEAGALVWVYALVYAISSPLLVAMLGHHDRKPLLMLGMALLAGGAALACVADSFGVVLLGRAAMAAGGGLITPIAASIGVATSPPQSRGRALALVFAGLPLAQALGIPLGTWLAGEYSWRAAFALVAVIATISLVALARMTPRGIRVAPVGLNSLVSVLREPRTLLAVGFIVFYIGSNFTLLTYLAPYVADRFHLGNTEVAGVLLLYGAAAFFGNAAGGAMNDRIGPVATLALLCLAIMLVQPVMTLSDAPLAVTVVLIMVWGLFGWSVHAPQQARLAQMDPQRAPVLLALHSAAIYVGSSLGATVAGQVLQRADAHWLGPAGSVLALVALASLVLATRASARPTVRPA